MPFGDWTGFGVPGVFRFAQFSFEIFPSRMICEVHAKKTHSRPNRPEVGHPARFRANTSIQRISY